MLNCLCYSMFFLVEQATLKWNLCTLPAVNQMPDIFSNKLHYGEFQRNLFFSTVVTDPKSHYTCVQMKELLVTKLFTTCIHYLSLMRWLKICVYIPVSGENRKQNPRKSLQFRHFSYKYMFLWIHAALSAQVW